MLFIIALSMIVVGFLMTIIAYNLDPNLSDLDFPYYLLLLAVPAFLSLFLGCALYYGFSFGNDDD